MHIAGYVHTQAADVTLGNSGITVLPNAAALPIRASPHADLDYRGRDTLDQSCACAFKATVITDQAVEEFANANHVSWDEA